MPIEHFLKGIKRDCVVTACAVVADGMGLEGKKEALEEKIMEEVVVDSVSKKRQRDWNTWVERCYIIFMYLHPQIFNESTAEASEFLHRYTEINASWIGLS